MNMPNNGFNHHAEQFADIEILRYYVPGFKSLTLKEKELVYYLYEAALSGRDIIYDQHYKYNLLIRKSLEAVVKSFGGNRAANDFQKFMSYTKRIWFSNGIHHHYSTKKILPEFNESYFRELVLNSDEKLFPLDTDETLEQLVKKLIPILFDPAVDARRVNLDPDTDVIISSANNFYEGLTQKEVEEYYNGIIDNQELTPVSYGLNS